MTHIERGVELHDVFVEHQLHFEARKEIWVLRLEQLHPTIYRLVFQQFQLKQGIQIQQALIQ